MIGDTAEGLQADHIVDALLGEFGYLSRDQPAFADIAGQVQNFAGGLGLAVNRPFRPGITKLLSDPLHRPVIIFKQAFQQLVYGNRQFVIFLAFAVGYFRIDKELKNKIQHRRQNHLHTLLHQPIEDIGVAEFVVFQVNLTHDPYRRDRLVVAGYGIEIIDRPFQQCQHFRCSGRRDQCLHIPDVSCLICRAVPHLISRGATA